MKEIVFVWNDFQCLCRYKVFSEEVRQMLEQPIELLGKGFANIEDKVTKGNRVCSWHLEIKETQEGAYLTKKGKWFYLSASGENFLNTEMVACLLLQIFLFEGLENLILPFHGAAVHIGGRNVLLLGESGAGKTTLAFELCAGKKGKLIGNDFVALRWQDGRLEILWDDRTSKMSLRKDVLSSYSTQTHFKDRFLGSENRDYYDPEYLNIQLYEDKGFIDDIFWIELSDNIENQIEVLDFQENMQRLYLSCMGLSSGIHLKLYDHQGNWISNCSLLPDGERLKNVYNCLAKVIRRYSCKEIRGTLSFALETICREERQEKTK